MGNSTLIFQILNCKQVAAATSPHIFVEVKCLIWANPLQGTPTHHCPLKVIGKIWGAGGHHLVKEDGGRVSFSWKNLQFFLKNSSYLYLSLAFICYYSCIIFNTFTAAGDKSPCKNSLSLPWTTVVHGYDFFLEEYRKSDTGTTFKITSPLLNSSQNSSIHDNLPIPPPP